MYSPTFDTLHIITDTVTFQHEQKKYGMNDNVCALKVHCVCMVMTTMTTMKQKKNKFEIYMHLGQLSEIIQSVDDGHSFPQNDSLHDTTAIAENTQNHQNQTQATPSTRSHSHTTTKGIGRIAIETQYVVYFILLLSLAQKLISSAR